MTGSEGLLKVRATPQQEGIYFHAMSNQVSYWNFVYIRAFAGLFDVPALEAAFRDLLGRHSSLRTRFLIAEGLLHQVIEKQIPIEAILEHSVYSGIESNAIQEIVLTEMKRLRHYDFDPGNEWLLKCKLLEFSGSSYLILCINHLITDAFSMQLFWNELTAVYNRIRQSGPAGNVVPVGNDMPIGEIEPTGSLEPGRQYFHFSMEQEMFFQTTKYEDQKRYWLNKFSGEAPKLTLNFADAGASGVSYYRELTLSEKISADIRSFSLQQRVLHSAVFELAYFLLLQKFSSGSDLSILNTISGRGFGKSENNKVIGIFANRVVNRIVLNKEETISEGLQRVHQELIESFSNSNIPYESWARELPKMQRSDKGPVFRAAFNLIRNVGKPASFSDMDELEPPSYPAFPDADTQYDIYLYIIDNGKDVRIRIELKCKESLSQMVELVLESYTRILAECVYASRKKIANIDWLTDTEVELMGVFNDTDRTIGVVMRVDDLFRRRAERMPEQDAILFETRSIRYGELERASDQLASTLRAGGVGPGKRVGLLLDRSPRIITAMLAVLKTGAAYLPMDPGFPTDRLRYMIEDAKVMLVISDSKLRAGLMDSTLVLDLGAVMENDRLPEQDDLPDHGHKDVSITDNPGSNTAYVIYTSGSTGQPKGVMISHGSIVNLIEGITTIAEFQHNLIYAMTTMSFDIFVLESLLALCAGATVVLASADEQQDPELAIRTMTKRGVNMLQCTPSRLKMLLNTGRYSFLDQMTHIFIGGEVFPPDLALRLRSVYHGRLFNMYGPTETTVWSTVKDVSDPPGELTIGKPIRNTKVYIIGADGQLSGIGIYGEICIAGRGLAEGYVGMDELNTERFVNLPAVPGEKLYRTGDMGRWLPDGDLQILGRKDDQVKIRGYRIEPGEIEAHLKAHPAIKDTVVLLKEEEEELYAFYVGKDRTTTKELRSFLLQRLPSYMVPAHFVSVHEFPFTPNNKIDKIALRSLGKRVAETGIEKDGEIASEISCDIDERLVTMWFKALDTHWEEPGSDRLTENFFESGGHSIKAVGLLDDIKNTFKIKVPVRQFFRSPTLKFLNEYLSITSNQ